MEAALDELCEIVPEVNGVPSRETFASNFKKHRLFFVNYEKFEENYADWYRFERQERHEILRGAIFDGDYYARQVDALLYAKGAAAIYVSPESPRKHMLDREPDLRSHKVAKQGNDASSSSRVDLSSSRGDSSSFRGPNRDATKADSDNTRSAPTCIICEGNHRLKEHPSEATSFADGSSCFTGKRNGRELWTIRPFQGRNQQICVPFNLPHGCNRPHDPSALHICSLCGREHGAIPRSSSCLRNPRT